MQFQPPLFDRQLPRVPFQGSHYAAAGALLFEGNQKGLAAHHSSDRLKKIKELINVHQYQLNM